MNQALSFVKVFGKIDGKTVMLLISFRSPNTKYGSMRRLRELGFRIPRATLYRTVDRLYKAAFLDTVGKKQFRRGSLVKPMNFYQTSLKGRLAIDTYAYAISLHPKIQLSEIFTKQEIEEFYSSPQSNLMIAFLKWHEERKIDLSNAKIDSIYFIFTTLLAMRDHPEDIADPNLRELAEKLGRMGERLEHDPKLTTSQAFLEEFFPILYAESQSRGSSKEM